MIYQRQLLALYHHSPFRCQRLTSCDVGSRIGAKVMAFRDWVLAEVARDENPAVLPT
jgi:hypothetical protein